MSMPKGPAGSSPSSITLPNTSTRRPPKFNPRRLYFPITVVMLGSLFFVYSRTSVQAAKENAKRAREADGGSINWRNESLRRHGVLEKPEERTMWQQLTGSGDTDDATKEMRARENKRLEMQGRRMRQSNPIEDGIRRARDAAKDAAKEAAKEAAEDKDEKDT